MNGPHDRFGMPAIAFQAPRESHGLNSSFDPRRYVCAYPPRGPHATCRRTLVDHDRLDVRKPERTYSRKTIRFAALRVVFIGRPDGKDPAMCELIVACDDYLAVKQLIGVERQRFGGIGTEAVAPALDKTP